MEYGLESQETIDKYEQNFKNYVPLRGFETTGEEDFESIPGFRKTSKRKKKNFSKENKRKNYTCWRYHIPSHSRQLRDNCKGEKNLVLQRLYKFAEEYRDNDVWETLTQNKSVQRNQQSLRLFLFSLMEKRII